MRTKANITTIERQKRFFWVLFGFLVILFVSYGYFVSKSITNILLREQVEQHLVDVNSAISSLEFSYLEKKNMISLVYAHESGFVDLSEKEYVTRKSILGSKVTLSNE